MPMTKRKRKPSKKELERKRLAANKRRREQRAAKREAEAKAARKAERQRLARNKKRREQRAAAKPRTKPRKKKRVAKPKRPTPKPRKPAAKPKPRKPATKRKKSDVGGRESPATPDIRPPKFHTNVFVVGTADPRGYDEGEGFASSRRTKSSTAQKLGNTNYADALEARFLGFSARARLGDPDAVPIYRFGINIRSAEDFDREKVSQMVHNLQDKLAAVTPSAWAVHIVNEGTSVSVRVGLGSYTKHTNITDAAAAMAAHGADLRIIMGEVESEIDDGVWFSFADIDDEWDY